MKKHDKNLYACSFGPAEQLYLVSAHKIYSNLAGFSGKFLINPVKFYDPGQISGIF